MRKFNLLSEYPKSQTTRYVGSNLRTIDHRIVASYKDQRFYDGDRNFGYGGFKYDGRWKKIASKIFQEYNLNENSKILQINCEKGFLLHDLKNIQPNMQITGLENSQYAIDNSMESIKKDIKKCENYINLKYEDNYFDFVIALGVVYTHNLTDAIKCLKEIQRVSKNKSFITLASYETQEEYWLFKQWTVLGSTLLQESEWEKVLEHVNFTGDYFFTNSSVLNLKKK